MVNNEQMTMLPLLVKQYHDRGISLNVRDINGHSPLFVAAIKGFRPIFNMLLDAGSDM